MNYKITFCILHPAIGFEEKDGITIELPFVPQLNSCLILSQEHLRLLETKAFESENKKHYLSKWNDETGKEWRDRGRDDIELGDFFYVQFVRYYTEDNKIVVVLNDTYETD